VGPEITIDYGKSTLTMNGKSFAFPPLSPAAQELIVAGGAEIWSPPGSCEPQKTT